MSALHHYPRRFRWRAWPTSAGLYVNGRRVGAVQAIQWGEWEAYVCGSFEPSSIHRHRCDAKRAVEGAVVRGAK